MNRLSFVVLIYWFVILLFDLFNSFQRRTTVSVRDMLALIFRFNDSWLLAPRSELFGRFFTGLL